jgi:hypothetical protein
LYVHTSIRAIDAANGMYYLEQNNIVHRDLAARNLVRLSSDYFNILLQLVDRKNAIKVVNTIYFLNWLNNVFSLILV